MKATIKYLAGLAGPSGNGSKSTALQVTQVSSSSTSSSSFFLPSSPPLTAIITGAPSGIGAETARVLEKRGVRIIIPARSLKKATLLKENIQKENPEADITLLEIDLSSLATVKRFCTEFLSLGLPLHILINNAGKFSQKLEVSEDKIEMTFATNYLGHFLLTEMLLEKMVETAAEIGIEGRIVNVSFVIHNWVKRDHFSFCQMLNPKQLAFEAHDGQRRHSGEPFIIHPVAVAQILGELDSYAIQSFEHGIAAQISGAFAWEIVPVNVSGGRGKSPVTIIDKEEGLGKALLLVDGLQI